MFLHKSYLIFSIRISSFASTGAFFFVLFSLSIYFTSTETLAAQEPTNGLAIDTESQEKRNKIDTNYAKSLLQLAQQQSNKKRSAALTEQAYQLALTLKNQHLQVQSLLLLAKITRAEKNNYLMHLYLSKAKPLLSSLDDYQLKIEAYILLANINESFNKELTSVNYADQAISVAIHHNDALWLYRSYRQKASTLKSAKHYKKSLAVYLLAKKTALTLAPEIQIESLDAVGVVYKYLHNHQANIAHLRQALDILETSPNTKTEVFLLINLAAAHWKVTEYKLAIKTAEKALYIAQQNNYTAFSAKASTMLARVYRRLSDYEHAIQYAEQAAKSYKKINDNNGYATAAKSLGLIYTHLKKPDQASYYFQEVLALPADSITPKLVAASLRELGRIYYNKGDNKKGLALSTQAYEFYINIKDIRGAASVKKTIGQFYQKVGKKREAYDSFQNAVNDSRQVGDMWSVAENLILMSEIIIEDDANKAVELATQGLEISLNIKAKLVSVHAYTSLIAAETALKNTAKADKYRQLKQKINGEINIK